MKFVNNLQYATIIYQQCMTCNCNVLPLDNYFLFKSAGVRVFQGNNYFFSLLSRYSTRLCHAVMIWDLPAIGFVALFQNSP